MSRHRKYQIALSIGMVITTGLALLGSAWATHSVIGNMLVGLAWVWEV